MQAPTKNSVYVYFGHDRGYRAGFTADVLDAQGKLAKHDSGLIYNDEAHARAGAAKFLGLKNKDGQPIRGSNISLNKHGELGRKASAALRKFGRLVEPSEVMARAA